MNFEDVRYELKFDKRQRTWYEKENLDNGERAWTWNLQQSVLILLKFEQRKSTSRCYSVITWTLRSLKNSWGFEP